MMPATPPVKSLPPWAVWVIGVALLGAAWGVVQLTPSDDAIQAPFVVAASVGEKATARAFDVTVTDPRLGDTAFDQKGWYGDGTWLVVDIEAESRQVEQGALLGNIVFVSDGVTYTASERPSSALPLSLRTGIPQTGSVAFELPEGVAQRPGVIQISLDIETRLDSLVEVPIDLAELTRHDDVEMRATGWTP